MDPDHWGALGAFLIAVLMMTPSTINRTRRLMRSRKTTKPDAWFDNITEWRNDFA